MSKWPQIKQPTNQTVKPVSNNCTPDISNTAENIAMASTVTSLQWQHNMGGEGGGHQQDGLRIGKPYRYLNQPNTGGLQTTKTLNTLHRNIALRSKRTLVRPGQKT